MSKAEPKRHVVWTNVYPVGDGSDVVFDGAYRSEAAADLDAGDLRIACVRVEFTEGDGL
jgi:hypothetical protein